MLHSNPFDQVVAVCWGGRVTVWDVPTGDNVTGFKAHHSAQAQDQQLVTITSGAKLEDTIGTPKLTGLEPVALAVARLTRKLGRGV